MGFIHASVPGLKRNLEEERMNDVNQNGFFGARQGLVKYRLRRIDAWTGTLAAALIAGGLVTPAFAQEKTADPKAPPAKGTTTASVPAAPTKPKTKAAPAIKAGGDADKPAAALSPGRLDATYGYKGWTTYFPSYADTLSQDAGGYRSTLADYGFGFLMLSGQIFQANMLDTPRQVPASFPACTSANHLGGICAGNQAYFGQSPSYYSIYNPFLTYDLGQVGLDGGQLAVSAMLTRTDDEAFSPDTFRLDTLSYYQPMLDNKLELKVGWLSVSNELIGVNIGGNYGSPFGSSATIPVELGMSFSPAAAPAARLKWNIDNVFYNQFVVQRSLPVNGPTGNPIYDEVNSGRSGGLNFGSDVDGTRVLFANEFGYKTPAMPGSPSTWIRAGAMYNTSDFRDFSQLATNGTKSGSHGFYFLADRQLWQQDPSSPMTAYRGIYGGVSAMYTPPETAAFYQNYEARLYWIGPFDSRPTDMVSVIYSHNEVSPDLSNFVNGFKSFTDIGANRNTNTISAAYTAQVAPGAFASVGVSYTDNPSISYFDGQGSSFNIVASLFTAF